MFDLGGEPKGVATAGGFALVGVNTSENLTEPWGRLMEISIADQAEVDRCDLPDQPDSVAIENERDEDLNDGLVPQLTAGAVFVVDLTEEGSVNCDTARATDITGLAGVSPTDPEPEFVAINGEGKVVVTKQENNHLVLLHRDGAVDLEGLDTTDERGALTFDRAQPGRLREPDAAAWIDNAHFASANEGDYEGGSRGWTVFSQDGEVIYDSGPSFEHAIVEIGPYPDRRSDANDIEPESVASATIDGTPMVFVGAERASVVGVYDVTDPAAPVLAQLLPSGVEPEGYAILAGRGLLVTANEGDLIKDGGARAHVMIHEWQDAAPSYPYLTSAGAEDLIAWGALSGLVADGDVLHAVNDSFSGFQPRIFTIDPSATPARITGAVDVTRADRPAQKLDLEGITTDGDGGFWLASEGRTDRLVPHALCHVAASGEIEAEIPLPAELLAVERRFGMEGVTRVDDTIYIAIQSEWADDPDNHAKSIRDDMSDEVWGVIHSTLELAGTGWISLSEITVHGELLHLIERDNQIGEAARVKQVDQRGAGWARPVPLGDTTPVLEKEVVRDLLPELCASGGYAVDKVEGLAIAPDGTAWVVTDNDDVDDNSDEALFWSFQRSTEFQTN